MTRISRLDDATRFCRVVSSGSANTDHQVTSIGAAVVALANTGAGRPANHEVGDHQAPGDS